MISKKALEKFKKLYEKRFSEKLSNKDALEKATNLLNIYCAVYGNPLTYGMNRRPEDKKE